MGLSIIVHNKHPKTVRLSSWINFYDFIISHSKISSSVHEQLELRMEVYVDAIIVILGRVCIKILSHQH